jgi:hypothetical protein
MPCDPAHIPVPSYIIASEELTEFCGNSSRKGDHPVKEYPVVYFQQYHTDGYVNF